jgi:hypothetical protein
MKTRRSYKDKNKKKNKAQSLAKKTLKNELKKEIILKKKLTQISMSNT